MPSSPSHGLGEAAADRAFFGHPRGLSTLFFSEMWERFSYYGMRGFLILYMTAAVSSGGMGLDVATAGAVYGTYTSLVYLMSLPGGWVADRLIGQRQAVLVGGVLIAAGHFSLAVPASAAFYTGLVLIVLGTGLLKPNISVIVGQLYSTEDVRRDAAFSLFYMGINVGAFFGPLITGFLAQSDTFRLQLASWGLDPNAAWHWAFGAAGVGMTLGLVQYVLGGHYLGTAQTLSLMQTEYLYPKVGDRSSLSEWQHRGSPELLTTARARVRELVEVIELYLELPARRLYKEAFFGGTITQQTKDEVKPELERGAKALARLAKFAPFIAGPAFTIADCTASVHLPIVSLATRKMYGEDVLAAIAPLKPYLKTIGERPAVKKTHDDRKAAEAAMAAARGG